jgi:hypothetical protein
MRLAFLLSTAAFGLFACLGRYLIGWEGRSPFPSPHTTVRTGPYTAVHMDRCMARC